MVLQQPAPGLYAPVLNLCASLLSHYGSNISPPPQGVKLSSNPSAGQESEPQGLQHAEDAAEHENMKAVLRSGLRGGDSEAASVPGLRIRTRATRGESAGKPVPVLSFCRL